jgi:(2R)-3-sulfolactate dehydrogenase (NADP+)
MTDFYEVQDLEMLACDCLTRAGVGADVARLVARNVAISEAWGDGANGFESLLRDIRLVRYGRIHPDAEPRMTRPSPAVLRIDARHGFAAPALAGALPLLIDAARSEGMAMVHLTQASDPGGMAAALATLAKAGLAAISTIQPGDVRAIRPGARQATVLGGSSKDMLSALLSLAPPQADSPLGGPAAFSGWLTALDPAATGAGEMLAQLPDATSAPAATGIALAPELLAQIVNA